MKDNRLKTYDIASYNIELDFIKQTAPIEKAIEKLNSSHEAKSLKAHKDFLVKEKASQSIINQIQEKSVLKEQRIERAVENKLKKNSGKELRYKEELQLYINEKTAIADQMKVDIKTAIAELQKEEQENIAAITHKFKTNIESYVEKLNIYNSNFDNNKKEHHRQINSYQKAINKHLEAIQLFYDKTVQSLNDRINQFLAQKQKADADIQKEFDAASKKLNTESTNIRKDSNVKIQAINEYVDSIKELYETHYSPKLITLQDTIHNLQKEFNERTQLAQRDLEINLTKLEQQLAELEDSKNKKAKKNVLAKIELFRQRTSTTLKYEERLLQQEIRILRHEMELLEEILSFELENMEKLRVFLLNDQKNLKETGDYFRDLNIVLKEQLDHFERTNNDYIFKHEQLKVDFIIQYTNIFNDLKQSTVDMAQVYLEKIADNNHIIDEINKFLDTAEPLKEIEVNRLREDIEINEVQERFKIKYAKQQYEMDLIDNQLSYEIKLKEIETKELLSEYNQEITEIRNKEIFDKAIEKAKVKHAKAQEIYKLRLNNTKLERKLLESKFQTEIAIFEEHKHLAAIDIRKDNALRTKEIEYAIKNSEIEANYKVEVIQKALEEDLLRLEEANSKAKYERDAYVANTNLAIEAKTTEINKQKFALEQQANKKIHMIDEALNRELREPSKNKLKTEAIIDERISKLDVNNAIFVDYINDALISFKDEKLTLEQIREIILNNDSLSDKAIKYISRTYEVLTDALKFMTDIEEQGNLNKIAATSDQNLIKKYNKNIQKIQSDLTQQLNSVHTSEQDHKSVIRAMLEQELDTIKKSNPADLAELINLTDLAYNKMFQKLQSIQEQLRENIIHLYQPLTIHDQQLIDYATTNSEKAKQLVLAELEKQYEPFDKELADFIKAKHKEQEQFTVDLDQNIQELRNQINVMKNDALAKTKEIHNQKTADITQKNMDKQTIEETEERYIVQEMERIDQEKAKLEETYQKEIARLDVKDQEAKKIFDYEDRIYTIALDSATSRYNDATVKSKNVHLNNVKQYQNHMELAKQVLTKNEHLYNQQLLDLTKQFEKNIFTVRPRLEESIGDAQKRIDQQSSEKTSQLNDLLSNNQNIITSAHNSLYTAFQEGYDRLSNNLQNYIEKYRLIEIEFHDQNQEANDIISNNNTTFCNALIDLSRTKHTETLQELLQINAKMYGKEE